MRRLRPFCASLALLFGLLLGGAGSARSWFAQQSHCDPQLKQLSGDPNGYRLRGDRCEGIYVKEVGSTTLLVASLIETVEDFNPASGQNLIVEWNAPGKAEIHMRVHALRHRLYYQMDTDRPSDNTRYTWQPTQLAAFNLKRGELGFTAWTSQLVGGTKRNIYLPLRISQQAAAVRSRSYEVALVPGVELAEVYYSLAPEGQGGRSGAFLKKDQALGYGHYPAERKITLKTPELKTPGVYYLKIGATLRAGGSTTTEVWFYHSGE
jgi:hypothetical protein